MNDNVAVLGPRGTFTEAAAERLYPSALLEYMDDVAKIFEYAANGHGDGVIAIENSLEGSVSKNLEYLIEYPVYIIAETVLDIRLCLMAAENLRESDIKAVVSHPHALGQCRKYLTENYPNASLEASTSTADAVKHAAQRNDAAAIGYRGAGLRYGLKILASDIQEGESQTRFIAISNRMGEGDKNSIVFSVKDEPGSLYEIIRLFAEKKLNLTKIESRPARKKLGEYVFHLDYESPGMGYPQKLELHELISAGAASFKYLGSY
jgi:prephenate dehydratase